MQYRIEKENFEIPAWVLPYDEDSNIIIRGEYEELVQLIPYQKECLLWGCLIELSFTNIGNQYQDSSIKTIKYKDIHYDLVGTYQESIKDSSNVA